MNLIGEDKMNFDRPGPSTNARRFEQAWQQSMLAAGTFPETIRH